MRKLSGSIFVSLILCCLVAHAQVSPAEGARLNYRVTAISFPGDSAEVKYKLEIAEGFQEDEGSFRQHIIIRKEDDRKKMIVTLPGFGKEYTWRVCGAKSGKSTPLYHFSVQRTREVDDRICRMRVITPTEKYENYFVFSDAGRALYDMNGKAVWYLPAVKGVTANMLLRDLKLSPAGTITFLADDNAIETDYNGKILWTAPKKCGVSGDSLEHYHHEFTRLANGHYMILGNEIVKWRTKVKYKVNDSMPDVVKKRIERDTAMKRTQFTTLIEYDREGKVVWSWKSSKHFTSSDLQYYDPGYFLPVTDVHGNSFFFDEKNKMVYVNFKGISRIVKIRYPEGKVVAEYGEKFTPGKVAQGNGIFCDEHSCGRSEDGSLYLYNNNACNDAMPTVLVLQEPKTEKDVIKVIREYTCNRNGLTDTLPATPAAVQHTHRTRLTSGGHVMELPDHAFFVCMNTEYGKMFIVDKNKKECWSAISERYNEADKKWIAARPQYRAHIISANDFEALVLNAVTGIK